MIDPFSILVLLSATIVVGYIGLIIFEKTGISDVIVLLLFGIFAGPVFNIVDRNILIAILPLLSAIALMIILFDAGLNMNFFNVVHGFSRSVLLAFAGVLVSMVFVGAVASLLFGMSILGGLLLGAILCDTNSALVASLTSRLKIRDSIKTMLNLESAITDPLTVIIPITLIGMILQGSSGSPVVSVLGGFSIGAVLGFFGGIAWLFILDKLKDRHFDYMLTISVLFMLYVLAEATGGSGAIMALVFGIVLGNGKILSTMLRFSKKFSVSTIFSKFETEISFFIRAFFFVYLGIIVSINQSYIIYGLIISVILIVARHVVVRVGTYGMTLTNMEANVMRAMVPRGLPAAVVSQLPAAMGVPNGEIFSNVAFIVILATTIYATFAIKFRLNAKGIDSVYSTVSRKINPDAMANEKPVSDK